jgi:hypothetical protein
VTVLQPVTVGHHVLQCIAVLHSVQPGWLNKVLNSSTSWRAGMDWRCHSHIILPYAAVCVPRLQLTEQLVRAELLLQESRAAKRLAGLRVSHSS